MLEGRLDRSAQFPHLAQSRRDMGHPTLWPGEIRAAWLLCGETRLAVRKIAYPQVFEFHVALSAGVQLQCDLAIP